MIDNLKPYPAYKDSGVEWMGDVPGHWDVRRSKTQFKLRVEKSGIAHTQELLSVYSHIGVRPRKDLEQKGNKASTTDDYWIVKKGDIICNKLLAWMGAIGVSHYDGVTSPAYDILKPIADLSPDYYHHLFRTPLYLQQFKARGRGIMDMRLRLYFDQFGQIPTPLPPLPEQLAIVRFLDHADRLIKKYIRAKQKLIKLLEEQKQAIIHRAVTRGLDPKVKLKPSGVEWLGDVPEGWEIAALYHRYSQCLGKMLDSKRNTGKNPIPYLRNTDVQWDRINTGDLPVMDILPEEFERYSVKAGDLLVCEGGEVGRCAIWSQSLNTCGFQKALHRLRPRSYEVDVPRFMYYSLRAAAHAGAFVDGHQSTISHLTGDKLRAHRFPFPKFAEQVSIVAWLDNALVKIEQATRDAHRELSLLREYRTRLIADVVTGKLDVREAAAALPDVDETEQAVDADETAEEALDGAESGEAEEADA